MANLAGNGFLLVDAIPTNTPTGNEATLARLKDTLTFYVYDGVAWQTVRLDAPTTYSGTIIPDNVTLGVALQSLETAIAAVSGAGGDGNHANIVRGNATENVAPTAVEVSSPELNDTVDILLTSGKLEKWSYNGTAWNRAFILEFNTDVSDTDSIDLSKSASGVISALLRLSATQGDGMTVSIQSDGLRVVYAEPLPPLYASNELASAALGVDKKFRYTEDNTDGAIAYSVAYTYITF